MVGPVALPAQQANAASGVRPVHFDSMPSTWQEQFVEYTANIGKEGVHSLQGYHINLEKFKATLPQCVAADLIHEKDAAYVLHGLEFGFDLGVDHDKLQGRRVHKNYSTAFESKEKLHIARFSNECLRVRLYGWALLQVLPASCWRARASLSLKGRSRRSWSRRVRGLFLTILRRGSTELLK